MSEARLLPGRALREHCGFAIWTGMAKIAHLAERAVVEVGGADRVEFLQGLVSNDVAAVGPGRAVWAALLTPQGKWLADFLMLDGGGALLLDCERARVASLIQRLGRYRLRSAVTLGPREDLQVYVAWDGAPELPVGAIVAPDPRLADAGMRILSATPPTETTDWAAWETHRLSLGLPDGSRDMEAEKSVLLEAGFDELHGISWSKGCYMGQELTARTKYRGLVKRRLVRVSIEGAPPAPGTPVLDAAGEVGTMRSSQAGLGLALLRVEAIGSEALRCGDATLRPDPAPWMHLPDRRQDATAETVA